MQPSNIYQTTAYSVAPISKQIDYFRLPVESLRRDGFEVTMNTVPLAANEWLSLDTHLSSIDHSRVETVALNIQVGKGKTTACYKLMERYFKEGYIVIVCSPFKRLVRKDCENLASLGLTPFNYENIEGTMEAASKPGFNFDFEPHVDHDIHVMTINCLLQNPGAEAYEQHALKQKYLRKLMRYVHMLGRKVVLFFDEVHESVHNFYDELVPNLFKWKNLIHKAYVSSATYTPAAIPVLKYIAALTNGRISVYETPRLQIANPTSLHLHITERTYSGRDLAPLRHLVHIIRENVDKKVNILTAHKNVAKALINIKGNPTDEIVKAVASLKPTLLTGDDEADFDQDGNNIGTTFKTGVDIADSNSVFIIIMPCISDKIDAYAIFSDGLPSIVQSLARIRHTGQVHVFMPRPTVMIDKPEGLPILRYLKLDTLPVYYSDKQNWFYPELKRIHFQKKRRVQSEIDTINQAQAEGLRLNYSYRTLSAMLIERSQGLLLKNHYSYGKQIAPYVLWAALYNQFCTSALREITYTSYTRKIIAINKANVQEKLSEEVKPDVLPLAQKQPIPDAVNLVIRQLSEGMPQHGGDAMPIRFEYDGEELTSAELKEYPFFMKAMIGIVANFHSEGAISSVDKSQYILGCTIAGGNVRVPGNERAKQYHALFQLRNEFLNLIYTCLYATNEGDVLIRHDAYQALTEDFVRRAAEVMVKLNEVDVLLKKRVYPFGPSLNATMTPSEMRRTVYKEFRDCFTNVTTTRKTANGEKDGYFLVAGGPAKQLPPGFDKILLF